MISMIFHGVSLSRGSVCHLVDAGLPPLQSSTKLTVNVLPHMWNLMDPKSDGQSWLISRKVHSYLSIRPLCAIIDNYPYLFMAMVSAAAARQSITLLPPTTPGAGADRIHAPTDRRDRLCSVIVRRRASLLRSRSPSSP